MGQFLRNSLFLQAFYEGRDRGGIFGKSHFISSAYVLSRMWKTPEPNKSLHAVADNPTWVKSGKLDAGDAKCQIAVQEEIVRTLMRVDAEQRQLSLFGSRE